MAEAQQPIISATGARFWKFLDDNNIEQEGVTIYHTVVGDTQRGEFGTITNKLTLPKDTLQLVASLPYPCRLSLVTETRLGSKGLFTKVTGVTLVK